MLSRVADSLYWLSRYIERAENLARLVEVTRRDSLEIRGASSGESIWRPILFASDLEDEYENAASDDEKNADVGYFVTLSVDNPDSIRRCIALARENARVVRDQISEEMWVELNSIHLYLKSQAAEQDYLQDPDRLFRKIIRFSVVFQGLTASTILHDEGWQFSRLGQFIERTDKTSRILDTLTFTGDEPERSELLSVLRASSSFAAFRKEYVDGVSFRNVASFLLFSQAFPRSVRFCLRRLDETLHAISGVAPGAFSNEAERLTGSALAQINFSSVDEVWSRGLHKSIDDLQVRLNNIGQQIYETYVHLPFEIRNVTRTEGIPLDWRHQQQQQQQQQQ